METIKARVHDTTIDKVAQFFDAGSTTVMQELFQNARRSGATQVEITELDESTITIRDNGHGIKDPQCVLDFGRSEWNALDHEKPAGMGLFALARYRITIQSRPAGERTTWCAEIGPEHFAGKASADVIRNPRNPEAPDGTTITITHEPRQDFNSPRAALHFPITVIHNGTVLRREPFLTDAVARRNFEGVEIGVFQDRRPVARNLNFHGVTARCPAVILRTDPKPWGGGTCWSIGYDVTRSPQLELVLPARDAIVQNTFSERLDKAATHFLFETVQALRPKAVLGYRDWTRAKAAGVIFTEPKPKLEEWQPSTNSGGNPAGQLPPTTLKVGPNALVLVGDEITAADAIPLYRALQASGMKNIFRAHQEWTGYAWYDAVPKITDVRILVENDGTTTDLTELRESGADGEQAQILNKNSRPNSVTFEMTTTSPDGRTETIRVPGDVAFGQTYGELTDDIPAVLLTKKSGMSSCDLEEMIVNSYFWASEEAEADSWETQLDQFRSKARVAAISIIESPAEALRDSLVGDLEQTLRYRLGKNDRIVIEQTDEGLKIDYKPGEATAQRTEADAQPA